MKSSKTFLYSLLLISVLVAPLHVVLATHVAAATPGLRIWSNAFGPNYYLPIRPVSGPQQTLAILVEFSDVKHAQDKTSIDDLIFGQMAKYYAELSYGRIQIVGKSVGWYTLSHTMEYYGADINPSEPGSDAHKVQLIRDAVNAAQDDINFNDYPRIIIVHAGIGQEDAVKQSELIWSEAYWGGLSIRTNSGAIIKSAAIVPEMESDRHSPLGVCAHEYGHLLSLLDLYDVNANSTTPDPFVGRWSLMGTGGWNGNPRGSSPAELEAWSRIKLGWLIPDSLELGPGNVSLQLETLRPLETPTGLRAIKIFTTGREYYLVEFRSRIGFDSYLPSEGVLITRIDESRDSGGGIVQVIDATPSTRTLNDAAFGVGAEFNDTKRHVFIDMLSSNGATFSVIVGNREPSSFVLTKTNITAPQTIDATYSRPTTLSARLADQFGRGLAGLPVRLQYYDEEQWNDLGVGLTDSQGYAIFAKTLALKPGGYPVRFLFAGRSFGTGYLVGSDWLATLNVRKISTNLQMQGLQVVPAMETNTLTVEVSDEFNKPVENMEVSIWIDNQLIRKDRITDGILNLKLNFGLYQLGTHALKIELEGNTFYNGASVYREFIVVAPAWFYGLIAAILVLPSTFTYILIRQRRAGKYFTNSRTVI